MNTKIQMNKTMKKQWQEWKQNPNETEHETHYCINVNPTEKKHENMKKHQHFSRNMRFCRFWALPAFPPINFSFLFICLMMLYVVFLIVFHLDFGFSFFKSEARPRCADLGSTGIQGLISWSVATARWCWDVTRFNKSEVVPNNGVWPGKNNDKTRNKGWGYSIDWLLAQGKIENPRRSMTIPYFTIENWFNLPYFTRCLEWTELPHRFAFGCRTPSLLPRFPRKLQALKALQALRLGLLQMLAHLGDQFPCVYIDSCCIT